MHRYFIFIAALLAVLAASCDIMASTKLEQAVVKALAADPRTAEYTFEVSYQEQGKVLITGEVFKPEEADYVNEVALTVKGVTEVLNHVSVEEFGSGMIQDEVVVTPYL
jgi:osmotically-inducible protein OsmY